jgi:hypothetical protein
VRNESLAALKLRQVRNGMPFSETRREPFHGVSAANIVLATVSEKGIPFLVE